MHWLGDHLFELRGREWALDPDAALTGLSYAEDTDSLFVLAASDSKTVVWEAALNGTRLGSSQSLRHCSGCSSNAAIPPAVAFRVVSLPAAISTNK